MEELEIIWYCLAINSLTFCVYGSDKYKAKHNTYRFPEFILLFLAFIGGSFGAYLAMRVFRHKTKHKKFKYGIPLIMVFQIVFAIALSL